MFRDSLIALPPISLLCDTYDDRPALTGTDIALTGKDIALTGTDSAVRKKTFASLPTIDTSTPSTLDVARLSLTRSKTSLVRTFYGIVLPKTLSTLPNANPCRAKAYSCPTYNHLHQANMVLRRVRNLFRRATDALHRARNRVWRTAAPPPPAPIPTAPNRITAWRDQVGRARDNIDEVENEVEDSARWMFYDLEGIERGEEEGEVEGELMLRSLDIVRNMG